MNTRFQKSASIQPRTEVPKSSLPTLAYSPESNTQLCHAAQGAWQRGEPAHLPTEILFFLSLSLYEGPGVRVGWWRFCIDMALLLDVSGLEMFVLCASLKVGVLSIQCLECNDCGAHGGGERQNDRRVGAEDRPGRSSRCRCRPDRTVNRIGGCLLRSEVNNSL